MQTSTFILTKRIKIDICQSNSNHSKSHFTRIRLTYITIHQELIFCSQSWKSWKSKIVTKIVTNNFINRCLKLITNFHIELTWRTLRRSILIFGRTLTGFNMTWSQTLFLIWVRVFRSHSNGNRIKIVIILSLKVCWHHCWTNVRSSIWIFDTQLIEVRLNWLKVFRF